MLYMFQAVFLPIIRSSDCTYSICYMSSLLAAVASMGECHARNIPTATCTADNSWWWAQKMPKTCRVSWQNKILDTWCILLVIIWRPLWEPQISQMISYFCSASDKTFVVSIFSLTEQQKLTYTKVLPSTTKRVITGAMLPLHTGTKLSLSLVSLLSSVLL
jgi:hypothetical protein